MTGQTFSFLEESDLLLLFGSRELRTALFALFTGHVQLIFFYKKDRILAFTRSVMASAAKKTRAPLWSCIGWNKWEFM